MIEIGEGCFGPHVRIDGQSLHEHEYATEQEKQEIIRLKENLLDELKVLIPKLDMMDWRSIAEIICSRGGWIWEDDKQYHDSCDQCGNYNWGETYTKE